MGMIEYTGPHDEVFVSGVGIVRPGKPFDAGGHTESLLTRPDFVGADEPSVFTALPTHVEKTIPTLDKSVDVVQSKVTDVSAEEDSSGVPDLH